MTESEPQPQPPDAGNQVDDVEKGGTGAAASSKGGFLSVNGWTTNGLRMLAAVAMAGWVLAIVFAVLYGTRANGSDSDLDNILSDVNVPELYAGGHNFPHPVILKISSKKDYDDEYFERMYISGYSEPLPQGVDLPPGIVRWRIQGDFTYLEVTPLHESYKKCPSVQKSLFGNYEEVVDSTPPGTSSCNLYDFRLVIYNNLDSGATMHFHGLTPPSNQDGVPFVANPNINPSNLQRYRFHEFKYPGFHWMHAHTGFQQAYGVSAPIIFQHADGYDESREFSFDDDLIVMLEDGTLYPKCAYSSDVWYKEDCKNLPANTALNVGLLINRAEAPVEHKPKQGAKYVRVRLLNGGSEIPWTITSKFSKDYKGADNVDMEILATDGQDVSDGIKKDTFVLGLANRLDVLVEVDPNKDILITAIQMPSFGGPISSPGLRHVVIRGQNTEAGQSINVADLPDVMVDGTMSIIGDWDVLDSLNALHPLDAKTPDREFSVWNAGGDFFGGFPMFIAEGSDFPNNSNDLLHPYETYTDLNHLKFQIPPYKVFRNKLDKTKYVSTIRECKGCSEKAWDGLRERPKEAGYTVSFDAAQFPENVTKDDTNFCCWEWCDVDPSECDNYELEDVKYYEPNKNHLPVCFGDRVSILFVNTATAEPHPMHLHGHYFTVTELYDVNPETNELENKTTLGINGPQLDTVSVPYMKAFKFEFDALNPGEHLLHCHIDTHLEGGMMISVRYMHGDFCDDLPTFVGGESDYPQQSCTFTGGCKSSNVDAFDL